MWASAGTGSGARLASRSPPRAPLTACAGDLPDTVSETPPQPVGGTDGMVAGVASGEPRILRPVRSGRPYRSKSSSTFSVSGWDWQART
ncbi:hypothetical protein Sgleb_34500 [Streptomyces glebosus]|uniref:Uncharacterized protein n=1 Tax=Streptomyces glebosus TaxID=249580 RepID=A0A640SVE4_9ACTN|nr:hypothetical protein Sgleb_34500 [Streptomyces glebosus]GHG50689.1 hypothetical protein GCM10010513_09220 [Streptomyces glebosus]